MDSDAHADEFMKKKLMSKRNKRKPRFPELSYAGPDDPRLKRWVIHTIEGLSGRDKYLDLYEIWCQHYVGKSTAIISDLLELLKVDVRMHAKRWPPVDIPKEPLVIVANHPFGIGDGMVALSVAERLGRPYRVIINQDLMKVPEIRPYSLPIDFSESREALKTNLATRKAARELLRQGVTIVVFPAGGVATAPRPFGKAVDLPWKLFPARLILETEATVLPIFFAGQNGPFFQLASKISMTLRLSLLIREFKRFTKSSVHVTVGEFLPFSALNHMTDRQVLTDELYRVVHGLGD